MHGCTFWTTRRARKRNVGRRCLRLPDHHLGHSICQPECQFDQSYNDDCNAEDNELSKNKLFSLSGKRRLAYPLGLQTISPTDSSPSELSNLPRPASAIPISCVKAQSRNCARICTETNTESKSPPPDCSRPAGTTITPAQCGADDNPINAAACRGVAASTDYRKESPGSPQLLDISILCKAQSAPGRARDLRTSREISKNLI
jgi:hypothetical protein